ACKSRRPQRLQREVFSRRASHCRVRNAPFLCNGASTLARPHAIPGNLHLVGGELWLAPQVDAPGDSRLAAVGSAPSDALPLILCQGGQEGEEAAPDGRSEIKVRLVEHFYSRAPRVHTLHDPYA